MILHSLLLPVIIFIVFNVTLCVTIVLECALMPRSHLYGKRFCRSHERQFFTPKGAGHRPHNSHIDPITAMRYPRPLHFVKTVLCVSYHYVTFVFKSWNIILVSHHIPRTDICRILHSVRRELCNMIEGDRAASRPLCQSPVNDIVIPLINMLKTVNHCSPASWEKHSIPWETFWVVAGPGKIPPGKRGSNIMQDGVLLEGVTMAFAKLGFCVYLQYRKSTSIRHFEQCDQ